MRLGERKHREVGRHGEHLVDRCMAVQALEELADLPSPSIEVGLADRRLVGIGDLRCGEQLDAASNPELPGSCDT
jgi:hypothetical protein